MTGMPQYNSTSADDHALPSAVSGHVLVVDVDAEARAQVASYLALNDFRVTVAESGDRMMEVLRERQIDLVALELKLRGEDGHQLARRLRESSPIPIIIVTSRAEEADCVMGLELGADDYVVKPFSPREFLARIRAVMRRCRAAGGPLPKRPVRAYEFAGWTLNVPLQTLKSPSGERVRISNGEFGLLAALLAHPQRALSRDRLLELSRLRSTEVYDRCIDVQILRLRRKIETDPSRPELIKTERGVGYRFSASVTTVCSSAQSSALLAAPSPSYGGFQS